MPVNTESYRKIIGELSVKNVALVAVSKTKPASEILELYEAGQRDFGENYVQELVEKQKKLPADIRWHFIGHLQSNKVKSIAPFVYLIHGVDSFKLVKEINKQAEKNGRVIQCLLQIHIAQEETKFGFNEEELDAIFNAGFNELKELRNVKVEGLMGMASFTDDTRKVREEFKYLKTVFDKYRSFLSSLPSSNNGLQDDAPIVKTVPRDNFRDPVLSMGMSGDYQIAVEEGSTMVRIGSLLFGARTQDG